MLTSCFIQFDWTIIQQGVEIPEYAKITEEVYDKLKQFYEPFNQMVSVPWLRMTSLKSRFENNCTYTTSVLHIPV